MGEKQKYNHLQSIAKLCIATFLWYSQIRYSHEFEKISCIANPGIATFFVIFQGIATFEKKSITKKKNHCMLLVNILEFEKNGRG